MEYRVGGINYRSIASAQAAGVRLFLAGRLARARGTEERVMRAAVEGVESVQDIAQEIMSDEWQLAGSPDREEIEDIVSLVLEDAGIEFCSGCGRLLA